MLKISVRIRSYTQRRENGKQLLLWDSIMSTYMPQLK